MTYVKKYKNIAKGTTPAMRRFKSTSHHQQHMTGHHKMPNPREAALEALSIDEREPTSTITKITLTTTAIPRKTSISDSRKRVCSSEGCSVQHTPIWWSVDGSDKKICQRCHEHNTF
jgi:hypothetical protein